MLCENFEKFLAWVNDGGLSDYGVQEWRLMCSSFERWKQESEALEARLRWVYEGEEKVSETINTVWLWLLLKGEPKGRVSMDRDDQEKLCFAVYAIREGLCKLDNKEEARRSVLSDLERVRIKDFIQRQIARKQARGQI